MHVNDWECSTKLSLYIFVSFTNVQTVFKKLTSCQFDNLTDLMDDKLAMKLEDYFTKLTEEQRADFRFRLDQVTNSFILNTRIIENLDRVFVEVSTGHYVFDSDSENAYEEEYVLVQIDVEFTLYAPDSMYFSNPTIAYFHRKRLQITCRFTKEFTKGITDEWTIDEMNFEMEEDDD